MTNIMDKIINSLSDNQKNLIEKIDLSKEVEEIITNLIEKKTISFEVKVKQDDKKDK